MVKELASQVPVEQLDKVEEGIQSDLAKKLGNKWSDLPATGPYMVIAYVAMNFILIPLGISPAVVADTVITKSKELELDEHANKVITNVKSGISKTGELSHEKFNEVSKYLKETGENMDLSEIFQKELDEATILVKDGIEKGKSFVGKLFRKKDKSEEN